MYYQIFLHFIYLQKLTHTYNSKSIARLFPSISINLKLILKRTLHNINLFSPQSGLSGAAAAGARGRDAVDTFASSAFQRIAEVVDPVRRNGERPEPVIFHPILLTLIGSTSATAFRFDEHRLQQKETILLIDVQDSLCGILLTDFIYFHFLPVDLIRMRRRWIVEKNNGEDDWSQGNNEWMENLFVNFARNNWIDMIEWVYKRRIYVVNY